MRTSRLIKFATLVFVVAACAVAPAAASAQEIEGQYIVVMKPKASTTDIAQAKRSVQSEGGEVEHQYSSVLKGFSAELDTQALEELRGDPDVDYVEPDRVVTIEQQQLNPPWGLDRIDQRALPLNRVYDNFGRTGAGVSAYILDTGINTAHADFGGRAVSGYDAVDGGAADDCHGHGTHVAGTVGGTTYGVAKQVRLLAVRVLNCAGSGSTSYALAGMDWVTAHHQWGQPAVANVSIKYLQSSALNAALRRSIADGVTYAFSAGNDSTSACASRLSSLPEVLAVGATSSTDARASFSNYGSTCVDLFAPGVSVTSASHASTTGSATFSGTSMAAPHVAGAAALILQGTPSAPPAVVNTAIINATTPNVVVNAGPGSPNRLLATL